MSAVMKPASQHRHHPGAEHEHEFEAQHGLPEALPADERVLWQGAPEWRQLAIEAFHARKLGLYFLALISVRLAFVALDGGGAAAMLSVLAWLLPLAALAVGTMLLMGYLSARTTAYTVTNKRVVMRVGIVLTVTFNLPFKRIQSAGLMLRRQGNGDIPLTLARGERIALLQLWPHVRPWFVAEPQPMLRCLPDAEQVAGTLALAWSAATQNPVAAKPTSDTRSSDNVGAATGPGAALFGRLAA